MATELLTDLTPAQTEAVTHKDGPCLVVAGAGTGKTKVITHRIAYLIQEQKIAPECIVALTFTDKAAKEMEERVDVLLPYGTFGSTISTFHSFCADLVKRHAFLLGLDPLAKLLSTADEISFLRQHLDRLPTRIYKPGANPVEFLRALSNFMSRAKDENLTSEKIIDYAHQLSTQAKTEAEKEKADQLIELANLYQCCQKLYQENSLLTYGDLIFYSVQILEQFPSARAAEQQRLHYLLIDEFQDTNGAQSRVGELLVEESKNIMVVGDDDQAIYSFRGANLANILHFTQRFPTAKVITLQENFRSTQAILDSAYRLIQHNNPERLEVQENISKQLLSTQGPGETPEYRHYERTIFEYQEIVETINELIETKQYNPEDIAILIRSRNQARPIETALQALHIPCQLSNDSAFFQLPLIQAALSFLRFLTSVDDSLNLFFSLTHHPFNLKERSLQKYSVQANYQKCSLFTYLESQEDLEEPLKEAISYLQEQLTVCAGKLPSHILLYFFSSSHFYDQVKNQPRAGELLSTLHEEIVAYETTHPQASLPNFIQHLDLLLATEEEISLQHPLDHKADGVQIMTVHKSKGLEFPVVFIPNLVQGRFPSRPMGDSLPFPYALTGLKTEENSLAEERRLAYVAITRAKERLYLSSSDFYQDRKTKAKPSPFISEALGEINFAAPEASSSNQQLSLLGNISAPASLATPIVTKQHFSPSALETYLQCPKQYEYQYILQLKVPASQLINFGISIHESLKEWFLRRKRGQASDMAEIFAQNWLTGGYENKKQEQERYQEGLERLIAYTSSANAAQVVALEDSCQVHLSSGALIVGKIDRIDRDSQGSLKIIDYKTGLHPKKKQDLKKDLPLGSYVLALQEKGQTVSSVELHYLMVGQVTALPVKEMDLPAWEEKAEATITAITSSLQTAEFPAQPDKIRCQYCDYRSICPFRYGKL